MNLKSERGFALPMTIMLVALLTVMLSAALARAGSDEQVTVGIENYVRAQTIAQTGLERFLDNISSEPSDGDTDTISSGITDGYAVVTAHVIRQPADTSEDVWYVIESTGNVIDAVVGPDPQASRTIGQMAYWHRARVTSDEMPAAVLSGAGVWTPGTGLPRINGTSAAACGSITISGTAQDSGLTYPSRSIGFPERVLQFDWDSAGGGFIPPLSSSMGVNVSDLLAGRFNYTQTSLSWLNLADVYYIDGNVSTSFLFGEGILVVTGNLSIGWVGDWNGLVVVGGTLTLGSFSGANVFIDGGAIVGANALVGGSASSSTVRGIIRYDPCHLSEAGALLDGIVPVENAWIDRWATY